MQNIIRVFKPWLDAHPEVSIFHTQDSGLVCVSHMGEEPIVRTNVDRSTLLTLLAAWFFDETEDLTWAGAAEQTIKGISPYLAQLPPEDTDIALSTIRLLLRFDEERYPPRTAP